MKVNLTKLLNISARVERLNSMQTDASALPLEPGTASDSPYTFELEDAEGEPK